MASGSLTMPEWDEREKWFDTKALWLLSPGKQDAYTALFEGTLRGAIAEAAVHTVYWQTPYTVIHAPKGRLQGPTAPMVKVSLPTDGPLKR